ncbi:MAG: hypothetical protein AAF984_09210, partial [Verrucomicrobiota bacterium]
VRSSDKFNMRVYLSQIIQQDKNDKVSESKSLQSYPYLNVFLALLLVYLSFFMSAQAMEEEWKVDIKFDIKGNGGFNACLSFAKDLYNRMNNDERERNIIVYDWTNKYSGVGRHSILIYRYHQPWDTEKATVVSMETQEAGKHSNQSQNIQPNTTEKPEFFTAYH